MAARMLEPQQVGMQRLSMEVLNSLASRAQPELHPLLRSR